MKLIPAGPFPHVYQYKGFWRHAALVFGGAFLIGYGMLLVHIWTMMDPSTVGRKARISALYMVGMSMGAFFIVGVRRSRVILHADAIETVGLFGRRRLAYEDIGAKMPVPAYCSTWAILPTQRSKKKVMFEIAYDFDQTFWSWFNDIPRTNKNFWKKRRQTRR